MKLSRNSQIIRFLELHRDSKYRFTNRVTACEIMADLFLLSTQFIFIGVSIGILIISFFLGSAYLRLEIFYGISFPGFWLSGATFIAWMMWITLILSVMYLGLIKVISSIFEGIKKVLPTKEKKPKIDKGPGLLSLWYKSLKDKTCYMIEIK